jgi:TRAP-type C4-dicarboxylate transport system substrate-binding protein
LLGQLIAQQGDIPLGLPLAIASPLTFDHSKPALTAIFVAFKMNDVAKTITVTNDTMLVSLAVVSKVWLDKLPPDLRKIVLDTGRSVQRRTHEWEKEFSKGLDKTWVDMGGVMHQLPPDDLKKLAELLNSVGDDVSKDQPAVNEMLKRVRAVAAKN